jgi:hypothetical protein
MSIALPVRVAKIFPGCGFVRVLASTFWPLGGFQDEGAAVSAVNFWGLPSLVGALVPEFKVFRRRGFVFVGCDPSPDGLPGWVDGFEGVDVEWWLW